MFDRLVVGYFLILALCLVACTAVPSTTPTPIQPLAAVSTVVVERSTATPFPSFTPTAMITATSVAKSTTTLATTDVTKPASPPQTRTPLPTVTPTLEGTPAWSAEVTAVQKLAGYYIAWSPTSTVFVLTHCPIRPDAELTSEHGIFLVQPPDFIPVSFTPDDVYCAYGIFGKDAIWSTDGQHILFSGSIGAGTPEPGADEYGQLWIADQNGRNARPIAGATARWFYFLGWLNDNSLAYAGWSGGGHWAVSILDVDSEENKVDAIVHATVNELGQSYIAVTTLNTASVGAIGQTIVDPEGDLFSGGPYTRYLSYDQHAETLSFRSEFMDWLPNTDQMLVLTWDLDFPLWEEIDLFHHEPVTQLQLWNVDTNELTLLVEDAVHGRFSPDGRYLAYITPTEGLPNIQVIDRNTNEIVFFAPLVVEEEEVYFTFSPSGRYFTYLAPNTPDSNLLQVVDLASGEQLASLPARLMTPVWSPDNNRFIYRNEFDGLALYSLTDSYALLLTSSNDTRLISPRWSFDSTYLSVTIDGGEADEVAILHFP